MVDLPPAEAEWIRRWGRTWLGVLDRPVLTPEPDGQHDEVDVEIEAPDGTRFDVADLRATYVGQHATALPLRDAYPPVPGTVTQVTVHPGRRSATLTIRIDDVPAWRAALPPEEPCFDD